MEGVEGEREGGWREGGGQKELERGNERGRVEGSWKEGGREGEGNGVRKGSGSIKGVTLHCQLFENRGREREGGRDGVISLVPLSRLLSTQHPQVWCRHCNRRQEAGQWIWCAAAGLRGPAAHCSTLRHQVSPRHMTLTDSSQLCVNVFTLTFLWCFATLRNNNYLASLD